MKRKIADGKTIQKLEKRLYKMLNELYCEPDGLYCEISAVKLTFPDGKGEYTIDVGFGFIDSDGNHISNDIDELFVAKADGKVNFSFVAGQVYQYIIDQNW